VHLHCKLVREIYLTSRLKKAITSRWTGAVAATEVIAAVAKGEIKGPVSKSAGVRYIVQLAAAHFVLHASIDGAPK